MKESLDCRFWQRFTNLPEYPWLLLTLWRSFSVSFLFSCLLWSFRPFDVVKLISVFFLKNKTKRQLSFISASSLSVTSLIDSCFYFQPTNGLFLQYWDLTGLHIILCWSISNLAPIFSISNFLLASSFWGYVYPGNHYCLNLSNCKFWCQILAC